MLSAFVLVPPFLRDGVNDFVGGLRYRWFGK
jgi:predicted DCC family thiol-disulfide oxidoreductase YuxK